MFFATLTHTTVNSGTMQAWDEIHGARGDIRNINGEILRAIRALAGIKSQPRSGFVTWVSGNNASLYYLLAAFNDLNAFFLLRRGREAGHPHARPGVAP